MTQDKLPLLLTLKEIITVYTMYSVQQQFLNTEDL
jgi:hypothetical protein